MTYRLLPGGWIRFYGIDAMCQIRCLVEDDENYQWGFAPWPDEWIDVYPHTAEDQAVLLEVVNL